MGELSDLDRGLSSPTRTAILKFCRTMLFTTTAKYYRIFKRYNNGKRLNAHIQQSFEWMEVSHVRFIAEKSIKYISFAICVGITHYHLSIRSIVCCVKSILIIYVTDPVALTFCCVFGIPHTQNFLLHFLINFLFGQTEIGSNGPRR